MLYDGLINSLFYGFQYPLHDFIRIDAVRYLLGYLVNIDIVSYPFGSSTVTVCRSALCASLFCVMGVSPFGFRCVFYYGCLPRNLIFA